MTAPAEPEMIVGILAILAICGMALYGLLAWVRRAPRSPDPWDEEIERNLREGNVVATCHKCSTPQPPGQWFCEHCGTAVGDYNNLMPYVYVFSEGEVFRGGVTERFRLNMLTLLGYVFVSFTRYLVFAPIYWYFLFKNVRRIEIEKSDQASKAKEGQ